MSTYFGDVLNVLHIEVNIGTLKILNECKIILLIGKFKS